MAKHSIETEQSPAALKQSAEELRESAVRKFEEEIFSI